MKKKILIVIGVFAAVLAALVCLILLLRPAAFVGNDENSGSVSFTKLNSTEQYQVVLPKGRQNIRVELRKGNLTVTVKDGETILFEERYSGDVVDVARLTVPEDGDYTLTLTGSRATGTVDYPISLASRRTDNAAGATLPQGADETTAKNKTNTPTDATAGDAGSD